VEAAMWSRPAAGDRPLCLRPVNRPVPVRFLTI